MASKAARKKRRLEEERRGLASLEARGAFHTQCSDVSLAGLDALLVDAHALLRRIIDDAGRARDTWPQVPAAYELRATIEEVVAAAESSRARLAAAHDRARRFQRSGIHVHRCGDLAVRMVPLVDTVASNVTATAPAAISWREDLEASEVGFEPDEDLPF